MVTKSLKTLEKMKVLLRGSGKMGQILVCAAAAALSFRPTTVGAAFSIDKKFKNKDTNNACIMTEDKTYRKIMVDPDQFGSKCFDTATKIVSVPVPEAAGNREVIVRLTTAGVQASDIVQMSGGYGRLSTEKPAKNAASGVQPGDTGCEGVGIITALGEGVDPAEWPVGQPVAFFGYGVAFREVTILPVADLLKVPTATPEWTALPVSALTAAGGLEIMGKIQNFTAANPASVLVTGAAGGTGHIAVQWAKAMYGARVAGTCGSAAKADMLISLGADVVVNYRTSPNVEEELGKAFPGGFDIVYDGVGGRIGDVGRRLLSPTGVFIGIGSVSEDYSNSKGPDSENKLETKKIGVKEGQTEKFFFMPAAAKMFGRAKWDDVIARTVDSIATGKVRVVLDKESEKYSGIEGVYLAQQHVRTGHNIGKIYASFPRD